jgi:hypothetical protein
MIFLALTRSGLDEAIELCECVDGVIWCGSDAISDNEFRDLSGLTVTRFTFPLEGADADTIADVLATIADHHPGEKIWIESTIQSPL